MVAHLDAVTSLAVDPNGLYLLSGSKILYFWRVVSSFLSGLDSVRTTLEKLENAALFLWLGLPSTLPSRQRSFSKTAGSLKRRGFAFAWTGILWK